MAKKAFYEFLPVFERNIFYGSDVRALKAEIFKYYDEKEVSVEESISLPDNAPVLGFASTVWLRKQPEKTLAFVMYVRDDADIGTVAHEATHTCNKIFEYIGQMADEWNDEVQAYLIGHLTKVFMEEIRGVKRKNRMLKKGDKKGNLKR